MLFFLTKKQPGNSKYYRTLFYNSWDKTFCSVNLDKELNSMYKLYKGEELAS